MTNLNQLPLNLQLNICSKLMMTLHPSLNDKQEATVFHKLVAKCLFFTKRARPDIATAVAFLNTQVKASDEDDWKKLTCMIRYLHGSIELPLILRADSVPIPK
jgi:hypothetical protein